MDAKALRACPRCQKEISAKATRCKFCFERFQALTDLPARPKVSVSNVQNSSEAGTAPHRDSRDNFDTHAAVQYRYKVVPFNPAIVSGFFGSDSASAVAAQLQALIDRHGNAGWEFHSIEKVGIQVQPGCLGQLLGQGVSYANFDQAIFRRPA